MSQILGIKFSDHGPVCYFASGPLVVHLDQSVLVETDQGLALGRVATVADPEGQDQDAEPAVAVLVGPAPFENSLGSADWDDVVPGDALSAWDQDSGDVPADDAKDEAKDAASSQPGETAGSPSAALFASDQATQAQPRPHSVRGLQPIFRLATEADLESHAENRRLARRAFAFCRGSIVSQNLEMKLVDVEVLHDRSKMIFFFTAPNRIDFRELIKSLVREFHTRIELRQIGVRHETQMIGAIGNCGQVCCCRRFLRKFAPVTIKMAKEQNLFLNPAKISGICGRLLCCLSYEQKGYEEFHKQCPKIGKRLQTPIGNLKVLRANFFKKTISVWVEDVGEREFTLDEWKEMLARQPGDAPPAPAAPAPDAAPQGRQGSGRGAGRPSTGRPARSERPDRNDRNERNDRNDRPARPPRPDQPARPEQSARPEQADRVSAPVVQAEATAVLRPAPAGPGESGETSGTESGERQRPRRKRRKGKGPKPVR